MTNNVVCSEPHAGYTGPNGHHETADTKYICT